MQHKCPHAHPTGEIPTCHTCHRSCTEGSQVAAHTSPTLRQLRLARRLRALRDRAGLSLEEAARRLDKTRSTLGRIEQGKTRADVHLVRSMMDVYDVRDDTLIDLAREAAK